MEYYLHCGSEEFRGDIYGGYDTPEEAAQAAARILLKGFQLKDNVQRAFLIVKARSKEAAERKVYELLVMEFVVHNQIWQDRYKQPDGTLH